MKTKTELLDEFALSHSASQVIEAFVSFGRGSIIGNIEEIAAAFDEIKAEYADCAKAQYIGPSREAATIFCNKSLTYQAFKALNIPAPWTIELSGKSLEEILDEVPQDAPFPLALKAPRIFPEEEVCDTVKIANNSLKLYLSCVRLVLISIY